MSELWILLIPVNHNFRHACIELCRMRYVVRCRRASLFAWAYTSLSSPSSTADSTVGTTCDSCSRLSPKGLFQIRCTMLWRPSCRLSSHMSPASQLLSPRTARGCAVRHKGPGLAVRPTAVALKGHHSLAACMGRVSHKLILTTVPVVRNSSFP